MESELFGYEKGAFTGARRRQAGPVRAGRTAARCSSTRSARSRSRCRSSCCASCRSSEFERVGGIKTIKVDVRLVTATNRDLAAGDRGRQLPRGPVLPAERRAAAHPAAARAARGHPAAGRALHREVQRAPEEADRRHRRRGARARWWRYHWPGNIRELENVIERTILFCEGAEIQRRRPAARDARGAGARSPAPPRRRRRPTGDDARRREPRLAQGGGARRDRARRARADLRGPRRDRRQRDPGRAQAQDLAARACRRR